MTGGQGLLQELRRTKRRGSAEDLSSEGKGHLRLDFAKIKSPEKFRKNAARRQTPDWRKGDRIILAAFGGEFTWGGVYLTWAYNS